jgi:hypothetical protein
LVATLSAPSTDAAVLNWRAELLDMLRLEHPATALDVYGAARLCHGVAWDERIRWAKRQLSGRDQPGEAPIATVRFWAPLERLDRDEAAGESLAARVTGAASVASRGRSIKARRFLRPADYREAIALVTRYRITVAAA